MLSRGSISRHLGPITGAHLHVSRLTSLTFLFLIIITDLNCRLACPNAFSRTQTIFVCHFLSYRNYYYFNFKLYSLIHIYGQDMEEKSRSNPFSISNILNNASSRENGRKDLDNTSEAGGTLDRHREFTRKQGCEIHRPDASPSELDRRMEYDYEDWSRTSVEG